eukprot:6328313-Amphidinium_carterae.1
MADEVPNWGADGQLKESWIARVTQHSNAPDAIITMSEEFEAKLLTALHEIGTVYKDQLRSSGIALQRDTIAKLNGLDLTSKENLACLYVLMYTKRCGVSKHRAVELPPGLKCSFDSISMKGAADHLKIKMASFTSIMTTAMSTASGIKEISAISDLQKNSIRSLSTRNDCPGDFTKEAQDQARVAAEQQYQAAQEALANMKTKAAAKVKEYLDAHGP